MCIIINIMLSFIMSDSYCDSTDKFEVKAWFLNPYTNKKIHFVICPSHQVFSIFNLHYI